MHRASMVADARSEPSWARRSPHQQDYYDRGGGVPLKWSPCRRKGPVSWVPRRVSLPRTLPSRNPAASRTWRCCGLPASGSSNRAPGPSPWTAGGVRQDGREEDGHWPSGASHPARPPGNRPLHRTPNPAPPSGVVAVGAPRATTPRRSTRVTTIGNRAGKGFTQWPLPPGESVDDVRPEARPGHVGAIRPGLEHADELDPARR
jgi:hypothetical protein